MRLTLIKHKRTILNFIIFSFLLTTVACGHEQTQTQETDPLTIVISNRHFIPETLTASPGETIFFINNDDVSHQILSQSEENAFDDTGDFDSNIIIIGATSFITIPDDTVQNEVIYFYDNLLKENMFTPNGVITIEE